ncbi:hypothetical protein FRC03_002979 [Tulasnella sp. 419]|nr:hypothetical protein FRC03_002979 [Tulasnella sp. 419]
MATMTSSMHRPCDSGIRCRSMSQSPNLTGFSTRELGPSEGGSGTISAGEFRSRRTRLSTDPSSHQSFRDGKEHATDEPTVILVGARSPTLLPRPLVSHVPFSPSTLHAPLVQASDDSESPRSLNPPPPVAITVSSASSAQDSSHSRTSIKRLPRLPTPDFTSLKSIPYKEALIAPLNFLRRGLGYQEPNSLSDAKETLQVPPSMESHLPNPMSDFPEQTTSAAMEHIDSSRSSASDASTVHSAQTSGSQSECSIRLVPQFRNRSRYVPQDHRHGSECNDEDTEKLIYRSDFQDETNSSFSNPRRSIGLQVPASRQPGLTSPNLAIGSILPTLQQTSARFTQKFPLWGLARTQQVRFHPLKGEGSSPDGVLASSNGLHTDTSQIYLDDGTFGFERIGRWSRFKWILLLSVMTVSID